MKAKQTERKYSYADLLTWDDGNRYELFDGIPYLMAPPSRKHQRIVSLLNTEFMVYLKGKECESYPAPFGVRLSDALHDDEIFDYAEPDITIVCDKRKLDDSGCKGSPDLVVEVLSPSNSQHDKWIKFNKYQRGGVKEYWIVDPERELVDVYKWVDGKYQVDGVYKKEDSIAVGIFDDLVISLSDIFE